MVTTAKYIRVTCIGDRGEGEFLVDVCSWRVLLTLEKVHEGKYFRVFGVLRSLQGGASVGLSLPAISGRLLVQYDGD